ncbi:unnamed protein product, partial [Hymenolepis diminuta]|uniref:Uncharacterized protein n=1 Tax=Hymenolepis diminuta TaxID=6216 RepID=A0A0R3SKK0_HYMDI
MLCVFNILWVSGSHLASYQLFCYFCLQTRRRRECGPRAQHKDTQIYWWPFVSSDDANPVLASSRENISCQGKFYIDLLRNLSLRKSEAELEVARKRARIEKTYDLARTLLDRRITHASQLNEKFSLDEMTQLMVDFGNSYKETVGMVFANLRQARLKEEREKPYAELLHRELEMALAGKARHECSGFPFTPE